MVEDLLSKKKPEIEAELDELLKDDTAGDPITGLKWTGKSLRKISRELETLGIEVNKDTLAKIMRDMGYSLRVNHKKLSKDSNISPEQRKKRNEQFKYISKMRKKFFKEFNITIMTSIPMPWELVFPLGSMKQSEISVLFL